ncbi:MAG: YchJ family protein [Alphaproteobacteria bacterium]
MNTEATICPCGSGRYVDTCCDPILAGTPAPTAEALMRSRYTAFMRGDLAYIDRTHALEKRDTAERSAAKNTFNSVEWIRLEVLQSARGGATDDIGMVEFAAHFRQNGAELVHRERSNFRRDDGLWVYVDGDFPEGAGASRIGKVGRNASCPCGSGKKFKKCCGLHL